MKKLLQYKCNDVPLQNDFGFIMSYEEPFMKQATGEEGWRRFLEACAELKTADEMNDFFNVLLTIEERKDVADRYLIIRDLLKGNKTQRKMAEDLHVSIAKITRGSNSLKTIGENLRNFLIKKIK